MIVRLLEYALAGVMFIAWPVSVILLIKGHYDEHTG